MLCIERYLIQILLYTGLNKYTLHHFSFTQAFEIAQHFMTMCGSDLSKVGREEFVPAKEFQLRWCQNYLAGLHDIPSQKVLKGYI